MHKVCTEWTLRTNHPTTDYFKTSSVDLTLFQKVQNFCIKPYKNKTIRLLTPRIFILVFSYLLVVPSSRFQTFLAGDRNSVSLSFLINYNKDLFIRSYTACALYTAQSSNFTNKGWVCLKRRRLQGIVIRTQQFYRAGRLRSGIR